MEEIFLHKEINKHLELKVDIPSIITMGLSSKINLREYQEEAIKSFLMYYENDKFKKNKQVHTLFHMATGSGKTVIMASLILYLYTKGYTKFLFFVNQTNILEKTKDNFTNTLSSKYLFNNELRYLGNKVNIKMVENFSNSISNDDIEIVFTTTQKLHMDLTFPKENSITQKEFQDNKVVFISDESHHINSMTKKQLESDDVKSWEYSVTKSLGENKDSIMLEFTATADLKDKNVKEKYKDKIVYSYPLINFRQSGYTKDFKNLGSDTDAWGRTLIALILSEYRRFLFSDLKLNIKPVVMLKSSNIKESVAFYEEFFEKIEKLNSYEIQSLYSYNNEILIKALNYFKAKDESFEFLEHSIQNSFTKEKTIIINGASDSNKEKQLLLNSLEDLDNPIRLIFAVDMLNEGWDVLNLFDIVRLHEERKGSKSSYTIKEAQLIGRGARYCPFIVDEEENKYKRKYDNDLENENRILETMLFHSKNDSKYISELKQALIATGLQDNERIEIEYKLKDNFVESDFYKKSYVFSNKRVLKTRNTIRGIEDSLKNKKYRYTTLSHESSISTLFGEEDSSINRTKKIAVILFKDVPYNILLGASENFNELKFNIIKEKYPNVSSLKEFLTSEEYLGRSNLEITYENEIKAIDLYNASKKAFISIANHIITLKPEYEGTKVFTANRLNSILKNKKIYFSSINKNGGKGDSQNNCKEDDYRLDLTNEDWYVFNDNYGTSEEKLFIRHFKTKIEPKLREKGLEFYVIRNERIPALAIYSFGFGERFEPDFLLLVSKKHEDINNTQIYIEPKGNHLLNEDKWKETFMSEIEDEHVIGNLMVDNYKILGMPFFNEENKEEEFENAITEWLNKI